MLSLEGRSTMLGGRVPVATVRASAAMPTAPEPAYSRERSPRHLWIVTGPAGCGKSTVAEFLAHELGVPYVEGDDLHPPSNRKKMASGIPLNDEDRWDWLVTLREAAVAAFDANPTSFALPTHNSVVVTCSALKQKYRDVIRVAAYNDHRVHVHFIYLHASEAVLTERVRARKGHYMGASMVQSQFAALEAPNMNECSKDVLSIDCSKSVDVVSAESLRRVRAVLTAHGDDRW